MQVTVDFDFESTAIHTSCWGFLALGFTFIVMSPAKLHTTMERNAIYVLDGVIFYNVSLCAQPSQVLPILAILALLAELLPPLNV